MAESSSRNFSFFGLDTMSRCVASALVGSFSSITPALCSRISARLLLLGSLGITTSAPSRSSASDLILREYAPKGSMCTPTTLVRSVLRSRL
ncbi:hypothetical protein D3C73_1305120 [compost metagenome]